MSFSPARRWSSTTTSRQPPRASAQELAEFRLSFEADNAWWAARRARTIPTALARITRAVKEHDADRARTAMLDHIEQWTRLNPDVSDLASAG